jgi:hypothetical protein
MPDDLGAERFDAPTAIESKRGREIEPMHSAEIAVDKLVVDRVHARRYDFDKNVMVANRGQVAFCKAHALREWTV